MRDWLCQASKLAVWERGLTEKARQMDYETTNSNGQPIRQDRRLNNNFQIMAKPAFADLQGFSDWLSEELEKLEAAFSGFATVRSFQSPPGR
jgi:hypothetical protein